MAQGRGQGPPILVTTVGGGVTNATPIISNTQVDHIFTPRATTPSSRSATGSIRSTHVASATLAIGSTPLVTPLGISSSGSIGGGSGGSGGSGGGRSNPPGSGSPPAVSTSYRSPALVLAQTCRAYTTSVRAADERRDVKISALLTYVLQTEQAHGGMLINAEGTPYLFDGIIKKVYPLDHRSEVFTAWFFERYGLLATEDLTRHVLRALRDLAITQGHKRVVRRFAYFDAHTTTLYLSRYDGTTYKLTGDGKPQTVSNGAGVLFLDDDGGKPCPNVHLSPTGALFQHLIFNANYAPATAGHMTIQNQQDLLTIWIFSLAFADLLPTKPLFLAVGPKGSGKTSCIQQIQLALLGSDNTISVGQKDEDDFGVMILRQAIALIDNVDTPVEWLKDALCTYATGGSWRRRKKYSDTDQIDIKPQAFIALATKNPDTFRRDDVADRCLVLRLERRNSFTPMSILREQITTNRGLILGEYIYLLDEVMARMRVGIPPMTSQHRMSDFARLAHIIGPVVSMDVKRVDAMLRSSQREREEMTIEGDSLVDMLDRWLESTKNIGREIRLPDLHQELSAMARTVGTRFYRTPRTLLLRLREADLALSRHFKITSCPSGSTRAYTFRRI